MTQYLFNIYVPSNEQRGGRPTAWQRNIQTPYFHTYSQCALFVSPNFAWW